MHAVQQGLSRLLLPLLASLLVIYAPAAFACSCGALPEPPQALQEAAVVFEGVATDLDVPHLSLGWLYAKGLAARWLGTTAPSNRNIADAELRVTFRVSQSWKGRLASDVVITTGYGGGDCGFPFKKGSRYIVYAYEGDGGLGAGMCSRTRELAHAKPDLEYLVGRTSEGE